MVLQPILKLFVGDKHRRERKRLWPFVEQINELAGSFESLPDGELQAKTAEFRERLAAGETLDDLLPEAYAVVKEACRRNLGRVWKVTDQDFTWDMVPFDVQLFGGIVLHEGKIAEMATGEGKTLVAILPLYLNALEGKGAHLVTVNDYLARRDSEWVGEILRWLGLTVGVIQNDMNFEQRRQAYDCDVTYGTNNEFGFDYLRDNMAIARENRVQRGHHYAIIDEVDSVLIDEARTPLIISGPTQHDTSGKFGELKPLVERLVRDQTRTVNQLVSEAEALLEGEGEDEDSGGAYEAAIKLFQAQRGMPKNKRLMKLLNETGVKKLVQKVEADFMRDKRVHELDEALLFAMDEKGHDAHLTDRGRERIAPKDPELFVVPDLSQLLHAIDQDPDLVVGLAHRADRIVLARRDRVGRMRQVEQLIREAMVDLAREDQGDQRRDAGQSQEHPAVIAHPCEQHGGIRADDHRAQLLAAPEHVAPSDRLQEALGIRIDLGRLGFRDEPVGLTSKPLSWRDPGGGGARCTFDPSGSTRQSPGRSRSGPRASWSGRCPRSSPPWAGGWTA